MADARSGAVSLATLRRGRSDRALRVLLHDCVCRAAAAYGLGYAETVARLARDEAVARVLAWYCAQPVAAPRLCVGTSGYTYRGWAPWYGVPQRQWLAKYAREFGCLELNTTFYGRKKPPFYAKLREVSAATGLAYTAKLNRYASHRKWLSAPETWWPTAYAEYSQLGPALKCILVQLAGQFRRFAKNGADRLDRLAALARVVPRGVRLAFEFRARDWYCEEVYEVLRANNWCLCVLHVHNAAGWAGDLPSGWTPRVYTADYTYTRLHGRRAQCEGAYFSPAWLAANIVAPLARAGRAENVVAFDNTDDFAPGTAAPSAIYDAQVTQLVAMATESAGATPSLC